DAVVARKYFAAPICAIGWILPLSRQPREWKPKFAYQGGKIVMYAIATAPNPTPNLEPDTPDTALAQCACNRDVSAYRMTARPVTAPARKSRSRVRHVTA